MQNRYFCYPKFNKTNNLQRKKTVLIYTRPWFVGFYNHLGFAIKKIFNVEVIYFSDYEVQGAVNLSPLKEDIKSYRKLLTYDKSFTDIRFRDRLLRTKTNEESIKILSCYYKKIEDFFSAYDISFIFSATIDQFFIDLVYLYCVRAKISFFGYHLSVLPGYTLMSTRGEFAPFRKVNDEEISQSIEEIQPNDFRPLYIPLKQNMKSAAIIRYLKNILRVIYFYYKSRTTKKFNYHYLTSFSESKKSISLSTLKTLVAIEYDDMDEELPIYIPLQLHPECNSEYWHRSEKYIDYEDRILNFCKENSGHFSIFLKEHPNMMGVRSNTFYRKLKLAGGKILDPSIENRKVITRSKVIVTFNSSVGIEGLIYKKPIYCLSKPYYHDVNFIDSEDQLYELLSNKISYDSFINKINLRTVISRVLSISVPVVLPDTNHFSSNSQEASDIAEDYISHLIPLIGEGFNSPKEEDIFTYRGGSNAK